MWNNKTSQWHLVSPTLVAFVVQVLNKILKSYPLFWLYTCMHVINVKMQQFNMSEREKNKKAELLTCPCFSLAVPWQSLISWPICPQSAQGRGLLGLNSSLMMVKFGSWVARPSMIRSAYQSQRKTKDVTSTRWKWRLWFTSYRLVINIITRSLLAEKREII